MAPLSPMMQQYQQIKTQYPDALLFFRLGDFYEMFFEDAQTASKELELTLTGRDCGQEERAPMCGVPYHSCDGYIARLVSKGYKVAICEQMEDPATAKGLVQAGGGAGHHPWYRHRQQHARRNPQQLSRARGVPSGRGGGVLCRRLYRPGFT